ncbi:hypothetical protein PSP20601_04962 [Pandoraea sputorum]|nr:hypothetical protein PSP20601_04962 [Pandoraea sputorum]
MPFANFFEMVTSFGAATAVAGGDLIGLVAHTI